MIGSLLLRGMLAGVFAGVLAYAFATVAGEPAIERAIAFEEAAPHAHEHAEESTISRDIQAGIGLLSGLVIFGATAGGLYAMAYALLHRRVGPLAPRKFAMWLAGLALVVLVLVPWLKYPANPPAIGTADTIGQRTALYFAMLLISLLACALALRSGRRRAGWRATLGALALYAAIVGVAAVLLPAMPAPVPEGFALDALLQFRLASLGLQLVLWLTIGLLFGELAVRQQRLERRRAMAARSAGMA